MKPEEIKHFELIQNIVTRMNTNSFQIKGFTIAITTAIMAVYARTLDFWMIPITYPAIILFWVIDSYYVQLERKFRGLYNELVANSDNSTRDIFDMDLSKFRYGKFSFFSAMFNSINSIIYLLLICLFSILIGLIK